jgi:hypothetical protein
MINSFPTLLSTATCGTTPWKPKLVTDVDEACDGINDTPTVVLLMEQAGDRWDDLSAAINAVAKVGRCGLTPDFHT